MQLAHYILLFLYVNIDNIVVVNGCSRSLIHALHTLSISYLGSYCLIQNQSALQLHALQKYCLVCWMNYQIPNFLEH